MGRRRKNSTILLKAAIISDLLAKLVIDRKELANRTGISYKYISNLLSSNPRSSPTEIIVGKIAKALGVEPWQIAEGMEPAPLQVREEQAPYGQDTRAFNVYQIAMARAKKVGLSEEELRKMGKVIIKIADMLTTEDRQERERYATLIYGMIALCQSVLFQQGGREDEEPSFPLEEKGG